MGRHLPIQGGCRDFIGPYASIALNKSILLYLFLISLLITVNLFKTSSCTDFSSSLIFLSCSSFSSLGTSPLIDALFIEVNPVPVKTAVNLLGFNVGDLRLPLAEMEEEDLEVLKRELVNWGLKIQEATC